MGETPTPNGAGNPVPKIAGLSALKGLVVYAAILAFAGLYGYFIVKISTSARQPDLSPVLVSAAAALAGVLGSAFALAVNVTTPSNATNARLDRKLKAPGATRRPHLHLQRLLTLDPVNVSSPSWPKTLGIWLYATVGGAVAVTYAFNPHQTPETIKALAVAFAGYILALLTAAYHEDSAPVTPSAAPVTAPEEPPAEEPAPEGNGKGAEAEAKKILAGASK